MMTINGRVLGNTMKSKCYDEIDGPPGRPSSSSRRTVSDRSIPLSNQQNEIANHANDQSPEYPNLTSEAIQGPRFPNYARIEKRMSTFNTWLPSYVMRPRQLADAGFFYLGDADNVNCFYCGGGVKDWESGDDPWIEHAKWYPTCKFISFVRGQEFVRKVPTPANRPADVVITPQCGGARRMAPGSFDIPPQGEFSFSNGRPLNEQAIQRIIDMGFSADFVHSIIAEHVISTGHAYATYEQLLDVVLDRDPSGEDLHPASVLWNSNTRSSNGQATGPGSSPARNSSASQAIAVPTMIRVDIPAQLPRQATPPTLITIPRMDSITANSSEDPIENIECKICRDSEANVCFLPCGHLVACTNCSMVLSDCPICRGPVTDRIRVYLS